MERKSSTFGAASALLAVLTLILPLVLFAGTLFSVEQNDPKNQGWGGLGLIVVGLASGILAAGVCGLAGTVSALISLSRGERRPWLGVVGLLVNGAVVALLAAAYVSNVNGG